MMRKSKVLEKLRKNEPVLCAKSNITNPWITEIIGMSGYDCIWLCMEHCTGDYVSIENCIRAAKIHNMDTMVRVNKSGYSDIIKPLELDASGIMYPHCKNKKEAEKVVSQTKFFPVGRRPIDGGNLDGEFCTIPLKEYTQQSNENKFLMVQIEDKEAIPHIDDIVKTEGIDAVFVGPGDLSHSFGRPGEVGIPEILKVIQKVAESCKKYKKQWGIPVSGETVKKYYDMGARFFAFGADVVGLYEYFKSNLVNVLKELP